MFGIVFALGFILWLGFGSRLRFGPWFGVAVIGLLVEVMGLGPGAVGVWFV